MSQPSSTLSWGHINVNVSDLEASVAFYEMLGFERLLPGIPYLGLADEAAAAMPDSGCEALGLPPGTRGRGCILQLGTGFPKLDLTELHGTAPRAPLENGDRGLVRLCLAARDLAADYRRLAEAGVTFLSPPRADPGRLADVAVCADPDGTLIELIQIYPERWARLPG